MFLLALTLYYSAPPSFTFPSHLTIEWRGGHEEQFLFDEFKK